MINVRDHAPENTPANGIVDWTNYIQEAIDEGIETGQPVFIPTGIYRITSPLRIERIVNDAYAFCSVAIRGEVDGRSHPLAPIIRADFTEGSAIAIQAGTGLLIKNLAIVGLNAWAEQAHDGDISTDAWWDDALYICDGITTSATSPYAAISFDPVDAGPTAPASSGCVIRCVYIKGWDVAIANGCSGNDVEKNGELIAVEHATIDQCRTVFANGHHETRGCSIRDFGVVNVRSVIDCRSYGRGTGSSPSVANGAVSGVKEFARTWASGGGAVFSGIEIERCQGLGAFLGGEAHEGIVIQGCGFNLATTPAGKPSPIRLRNETSLRIEGVSIAGESAVEPIWIVNHGRLSLTRVRLGYGTGAVGEQPAVWIAGSQERVRFDDVESPQADSPSGLWQMSQLVTVDSMANADHAPMMPGASIVENAPVFTDSLPQFSRSGFQLIGIGTVEIDFVGDGTATFIATKVTNLRIGDVLRTQQFYAGARLAVGVIADIDPDTKLVTLASVPEAVASESATESHDLYLARTPRMHWPTTGNIVQGSFGANKIAGIVSPWGDWPSSWHVGDRIWAADTSGNHPPSQHRGTYIVSVDSQTDSLILSEPFDWIVDGVSLYDADMRALATETR